MEGHLGSLSELNFASDKRFLLGVVRLVRNGLERSGQRTFRFTIVPSRCVLLRELTDLAHRCCHNLSPAMGLPRYARWRRGCRDMHLPGLGCEHDELSLPTEAPEVVNKAFLQQDASRPSGA